MEAFLIGRLVFGGFFLYNGINHFKQWRGLAQYAGAKQVPAPSVAVPFTGLLLLIGGASVILGLKPKLGAAAIVAFLASVSPMMHDYLAGRSGRAAEQHDPFQQQHGSACGRAGTGRNARTVAAQRSAS